LRIAFIDILGWMFHGAAHVEPSRFEPKTGKFRFWMLLFSLKSSKRRQAPNAENGTVPPRLTAHAREYLTVNEVGLLMETARDRGRYGHRDATMILVGYRHGLWSGELCLLRWDQVDLEHGLIHVLRLKNGMPSVHPIGGTENSSAA
jgi:type 1 fimbriae regulatory protein FimB/type 1 fimbriae regulatory protein FimE